MPFPQVRVPGFDAPPGTTVDLLEHTTRLARLLWVDPPILGPSAGGSSAEIQASIMATCAWLGDECWAQHALCNQVVLAPYLNTQLYTRGAHTRWSPRRLPSVVTMPGGDARRMVPSSSVPESESRLSRSTSTEESDDTVTPLLEVGEGSSRRAMRRRSVTAPNPLMDHDAELGETLRP